MPTELDDRQKQALVSTAGRKDTQYKDPDTGEPASMANVVTSEKDMMTAMDHMQGNLGDPETRGVLKDAATAPMNLNTGIMAMVAAAPAALRARGKENRSHGVQMLGPAGAGKTFTSTMMTSALNSLTALTLIGKREGLPSKEIQKGVADVAKYEFGAESASSGFDMNWESWSEDFVDGVDSWETSAHTTGEVQSQQEMAVGTFNQTRGLLQEQNKSIEGSETVRARIRQVLPDAPFTVTDDLMSNDSQDSVRAHRDFISSLGDGGGNTAMAVFTSNMDAPFLDKYMEHYVPEGGAAEGATSRSGLMMITGPQSSEYLAHSKSIVRGSANEITRMKVAATIATAGSEPSERVSSEDIQNARNTVNGQKSRGKNPNQAHNDANELQTTIKQIETAVGGDYSVANHLNNASKNPEAVFDMLVSTTDQGTHSGFETLLIDAMEKGGVDPKTRNQLATKFSESLTGFQRSAGLKLGGTAFSTLEGQKGESLLTNSDEHAGTIGDVNDALMGDGNVSEADTNKLREGRSEALTKRVENQLEQQNGGKKEALKESLEGRQGGEHSLKRAQIDPQHHVEAAREQNKKDKTTTYDKSGLANAHNLSHSCSTVQSDSVSDARHVELSKSGDSVEVLDVNKLSESRGMKQMNETIEGIVKHSKNKKDGKKNARQFALDTMGIHEGTHGVMKNNGLYAGGEATTDYQDFQGLLESGDFKVGDPNNPTPQDFDTVQEFIKQISGPEFGGGSSAQLNDTEMNKQVGSMMDKLVNEDGTINPGIESGLDDFENILGVFGNNQEEMQNRFIGGSEESMPSGLATLEQLSKPDTDFEPKAKSPEVKEALKKRGESIREEHGGDWGGYFADVKSEAKNTSDLPTYAKKLSEERNERSKVGSFDC